MKKARSPSMLIYLFLVLCFCADSVYGGENSNIDRIVSKFIQKLETDSAYVGINYTHEEWEITSDIKDGVVTRKEEKTYFIVKGGEGLYRKLLSKNRIPVKKPKFEKKEEIVPFNSSFFQRYVYTFNRIGILSGQECWILSFKPKAGLLEDKKKDRVLNNLCGEVWISKDTLDFKKMVARLPNEITFAWPGFTGGDIKKLECSVLGVIIDGHSAVGYVSVEYAYTGRAFFFPVIGHSIKEIEYKDYERRTK